MEQQFKVPIQNLFYMLSYAHDLPKMTHYLNDVDDELISYDMLAEMFYNEAVKIIYYSMQRHYVEEKKETSFISGRLVVNDSLRMMMEQKPVLVCEKDEFSNNILLNQVMKATLQRLFQNQWISKKRRHMCFRLWEELFMVDSIHLSKHVFKRLVFHKHNIHYKRMIHLAWLLFELTLLSHKKGNWDLFTAYLEEHEMNKLFEDFLYNFYRLEQQEYHVKSDTLHWNLSGNEKFLPQMLTDISLTHKLNNYKIVIDAKFYKNILQTNFKKQSFHSGNMYQMFTYLQHQPDHLERVRGILIYPYNGRELNEVYEWDERVTMEFVTINLNDDWNRISHSLMAIIKEPSHRE